jgi:hypothetical protein
MSANRHSQSIYFGSVAAFFLILILLIVGNRWVQRQYEDNIDFKNPVKASSASQKQLQSSPVLNKTTDVIIESEVERNSVEVKQEQPKKEPASPIYEMPIETNILVQ